MAGRHLLRSKFVVGPRLIHNEYKELVLHTGLNTGTGRIRRAEIATVRTVDPSPVGHGAARMSFSGGNSHCRRGSV
jgi:hypothetical protein